MIRPIDLVLHQAVGAPADDLLGELLGEVHHRDQRAGEFELRILLPIYANGASGWHTVWGPSGGYLVAFPIAAWAI